MFIRSRTQRVGYGYHELGTNSGTHQLNSAYLTFQTFAQIKMNSRSFILTYLPDSLLSVQMRTQYAQACFKIILINCSLSSRKHFRLRQKRMIHSYFPHFFISCTYETLGLPSYYENHRSAEWAGIYVFLPRPSSLVNSSIS